MISDNSGHRVFALFERPLAIAENIAAAGAGIATVLAMALTTIDALSRYFLNSPLVFQFYFTSHYLLPALVLLALPWGFRTGGYIRVSILTEHIPMMFRLPLFRLGLLASALYLALLTWKSWQYYFDAYQKGLIYIEALNWSVAWSWVWIPIGCGLLTLRVFMTAIGPNESVHIEHDPEEEI